MLLPPCAKRVAKEGNATLTRDRKKVEGINERQGQIKGGGGAV